MVMPAQLFSRYGFAKPVTQRDGDACNQKDVV